MAVKQLRKYVKNIEVLNGVKRTKKHSKKESERGNV
jgi:hypothetical protein